MKRRNREFRADCSELEGRVQMTGVAVPIVGYNPVWFEGTQVNTRTGAAVSPLKVVTQSDGSAQLTVNRAGDEGSSLQVRVTTVPSMYVGVNVAAVDTTLTFAPGQTRASVDVPILAGAPNPGAVDILLEVRPVGEAANAPRSINAELDLRVIRSDPADAPKVVSTYLTNDGIVMHFSKPMDPASVADLKNYALNAVNHDTHTTGGVFGFLFKSTKSHIYTRKLKIRSATYDAETQSVTLGFNDPARSTTLFGPMVYETIRLRHEAKRPTRPGTTLKAQGSLADAQGNLINADTTPGKINLRLSTQTSTRGSGWLNPMSGFA